MISQHMIKFSYLLAALMLTFGKENAEANTASFDCDKAAARIEKMICSDMHLSLLDQRMHDVYRALLKKHSAQPGPIQEDQKNWLKGEREKGCWLPGRGRQHAVNCLKTHYEKRISNLISKEFFVCGPVEMKEHSPTMQCYARNTPPHLSLALRGNIKGGLITLTIEQKGIKTQEIEVSSDSASFEHADEVIQVLDFNFDGYNDIKLLSERTAGPNTIYKYWLYNPETAVFMPSDIGDMLYGFDVIADSRTKTIVTSIRGNCCSWGTATYKWVNGALRQQSNAHTGALYVSVPSLSEPYHLECGSEINHYNDNEELISTEIEADEVCYGENNEPKPGPDISELLAQLKEKQKGYVIQIKNKRRFTMLYEKPIISP